MSSWSSSDSSEASGTAAVKVLFKGIDFIVHAEQEMPEDYAAANLRAEERNSITELPSSLADLVNMYPKGDTAQWEVRVAVEDVLKQMLHPDGEQRLSPFKPLRQPFSTRSHLTELSDSRDDMTPSQTLTSLCPVEEPDLDSDIQSSQSTPATRSSVGVKPSDSYEDCCADKSDRVSWSSYTSDSFTSVSSLNNEDSASKSSFFFDLGSSDEDSVCWSSDGATETSSTVSVCSGRPVKLLKRFQRFFSRIRTTLCCCWRPSVED